MHFQASNVLLTSTALLASVTSVAGATCQYAIFLSP